MPGEDPEVRESHSIRVEADGILTTFVSEISGLRLERDVIELQQTGPDGTTVVTRLPGRLRSGEVALTRVRGADDGFERWMRDPDLGEKGGSTVTVTVFDEVQQRVAAHVLTDAWPRRLDLGGLTAGTPSVLTETLTLVYATLLPG
jgi:phage tail-like protein